LTDDDGEITVSKERRERKRREEENEKEGTFLMVFCRLFSNFCLGTGSSIILLPLSIVAL
jgi:hypothetical protein